MVKVVVSPKLPDRTQLGNSDHLDFLYQLDADVVWANLRIP